MDREESSLLIQNCTTDSIPVTDLTASQFISQDVKLSFIA
jgi:hypothetical protein